jgi:hypothetical protein
MKMMKDGLNDTNEEMIREGLVGVGELMLE